MNNGNNYYMNKVFYCTKRLLKFKSPNELVSDEDLMNLFVGFVRLIKKSSELEAEEKYSKKIAKLERELRILKKC